MCVVSPNCCKLQPIEPKLIRLSALGAWIGSAKRPPGHFCRFSAAPGDAKPDPIVAFGCGDAKSGVVPFGLDARTWRRAHALTRHSNHPSRWGRWGKGQRLSRGRATEEETGRREGRRQPAAAPHRCRRRALGSGGATPRGAIVRRQASPPLGPRCRAYAPGTHARKEEE
jgi:hypothetical protein